jgi:phosphoribosylformylglycinamidine (FGAM) synthase PurS component
MTNKDVNMKDVVVEAKKEIFEGKSGTVRSKLQNLMGSVDGVKACRAIMLKKVEKELADAEAELERFSAMTVEDAFNEIMAPQSNPLSGCVGSTCDGSWHLTTKGGYPVVYNR